MNTDEMEARVLEILAADPESWFSSYHYEIVEACGGTLPAAEAVCKHLRQTKKVGARGRGQFAQYAHKL
jgi:hypothetical protein